MKIMACFLVLFIAGCTDVTHESETAAINCAIPPAGFNSLNDPEFTTKWPVGLDGYHHNTVKVSRDGAISWNGTDLATMHDDGLPAVEKYISLLSGFSFQPFMVLDFDAGAPCDKIKAVRRLMVKHLRCKDQDPCFQGNWDNSFGTDAS